MNQTTRSKASTCSLSKKGLMEWRVHGELYKNSWWFFKNEPFILKDMEALTRNHSDMAEENRKKRGCRDDE